MSRDRLAVLPTLPAAWNGELAKQLGTFFQRIRDIINGGIVEGVHTASAYVTAEINAPTSTSPRVKSPYTAKPASVELIEIWQVSGEQAPVSLSATFAWTWADGEIVLPQLSGLTGNETYRIVLLVRGG